MRESLVLVKKPILLTTIFTVITLFNLVYRESPLLLVLTLPQIALVMYYIISGDLRRAFFYHCLFTIACVNAGTVVLEGVMSYAKLKLIGPFTLNYIVLGLIWLLSLSHPLSVDKNSLLLKFRKIALAFIIAGTSVGLIGLIIDSNYMLKYLIENLLYIVLAFMYVDIFIKLYSEMFSKAFAIATICMIVASTIAVFLSFTFFGVSADYSIDETFINNPIYNIAPCLLIAVFQLKDYRLKMLSIVGIAFYVLGALITARGSTFLTSFVALALLLYIVYIKRSSIGHRRLWFVVLPIVLIAAIPVLLNSILSGATVSNTKFSQFTSLFGLFNFSNGFYANLSEVGRSPYIRIAEFLNIIDNGMHNILTFIIGKGYGGYYTDSLHLFVGVDLSMGVFPDDMIQAGRFYKGHSVYPTALMYNGIIGLFLLLKLGFSYLKNIDKTFLVYSGFMLFMYSFYFDTVALISYFITLFGAEYMINGKGEEKSIC